jgi:hypothetical protein
MQYIFLLKISHKVHNSCKKLLIDFLSSARLKKKYNEIVILHNIIIFLDYSYSSAYLRINMHKIIRYKEIRYT